MGFKWGLAFLVGFFALALGNKTFAESSASSHVAITLLLFDDTHSGSSSLSLAEEQAAEIFHYAGVDTTWIYCSDGTENGSCRWPLPPNTFMVHLVAHGKTSSDLVYGSAFLGAQGEGMYCDIFLDRIDRDQLAGIDADRLLGTVIAHEVGHLLLGLHAHSAGGLMKSSWGHEEMRRISMGALLFAPDQSSLIRARVREATRPYAPIHRVRMQALP